MDKSLCLFLFLCIALLEVQCLECYICDNCPKAKLDEIQTCGPTIISKPSTTTTESPATTTVTTKLPTTFTSTILTTEAVSEFTTATSTIPIEAITTSTTKTEAATTTETIPTSTESTTPTVASSTNALEPTIGAMISPADAITFSTDTIINISDFPSTGIESQQITIPTEAAITSALLTTSTITDATTISTTTALESPILNETVSEAVISSTTKEKPSPTHSTVSFISTLPTTTEVPFSTYPVTEPTIQTFSKLPTLTKQNMESAVQNIPTLSLAEPIATFTAESAQSISTIPAAIYPESTLNNTISNKEANVTYSSRRTRSSSETCECKSGEKCDCLTHQRSKRYTMRGLSLSKEAVKYVCFVDKYKINETEVVKRGCAIKEVDEKTLCTKLGFGGDCKICDTHQCNGAAIIRASILLMFSFCFI